MAYKLGLFVFVVILAGCVQTPSRKAVFEDGFMTGYQARIDYEHGD